MSSSEDNNQDFSEEEIEMEKRVLAGIEAERKGKVNIEIDKVGLEKCINQLKTNLPWDERLDMTASLPEIENPDDDIKRELAFYESTLQSVIEARHLLEENNIPFLKPKDFICEMVKDNKQLTKIEDHKERVIKEKKERERKIIKQKKNKARKNPRKYSRRR